MNTKDEATNEERVELGQHIIDVLERMDLNTREQISIIFVALIVLWTDKRLPLDKFDTAVAAARETIHEKLKEIS